MSAGTEAKFETKSVKTVRGMEARTRTKFENEGWEFVSQTQGSIRSELFFRRPKPKVPWKLVTGGAMLMALLIIAGIIVESLGSSEPTSDVTGPAPSPSSSQVETVDESARSVKPPSDGSSATPTTVDSLLDMLNSPHVSGIKLGDQFQLTGELFMSELWTTGLSGDFFVMLKAQGGAQDLSVFVDQSETYGWHDGTKVKMTVEVVEATINGETTDGWLRAISVQTLP